MDKEKVIDIEELAQDRHNFNRGNEQGQELMERSFKELGAGRSILLDRNGNIIAGNKSQKAAIAAGIKRVRVVETTGDELVAVKRTDVDIDSAEGRKMAYLDNLTTQVNLTWDQTELEAVQADVEGFDIADFGIDLGFGTDEPKEKKQPKETALRPFATNHLLISYPIDLHDRIMQLIEELREDERVEIDSSAN